MNHFKTYNEFKNIEEINEGFFDKLFSFFSSIFQMFKNPQNIQKSVEAVITDEGKNTPQNFIPKSIAIKETYFLMLGDGKNKNTDFVVSITKLANLPDDSGLFQISGTTNPNMLKALTGTNVMEDLSKNNVYALISDKSLLKGKPMTIKILKNILPGGKDYVSKFMLSGIAPGMEVEKIYNKNK